MEIPGRGNAETEIGVMLDEVFFRHLERKTFRARSFLIGQLLWGRYF